MTEDVFATKLKQLRKKRGISQAALANILHVSRSCVANYEKGDRQPDIAAVCKLADYFGVTIDYLYGHAVAQETVKQKALPTKLDITELEPTDRLAMISFYRFICDTTADAK